MHEIIIQNKTSVLSIKEQTMLLLSFRKDSYKNFPPNIAYFAYLKPPFIVVVEI